MELRQTVAGAITAAVLTIAAAVGVYQFSAVDTAGSPVSVEQAVQLKAQGTTLFIQALTWWPSCSHPTSQPHTRVNSLRNAQTGGLDIAGYLLLDNHSSGTEAVDRARDGIPDDLWDSMQFVAIDFEIPGECYSTGTRIYINQVQEAADRLVELDKPCTIYTSYGEWGSRMTPQDAPHPVGCYLWEASWDGRPDVDFDKHPFGGWTSADVFLEQYNGNSERSGVYVDLNSMIPGLYPWLYKPIITPPCSASLPPDANGNVFHPCMGTFTNAEGWTYDPAKYGFGVWSQPDGAEEWGECNLVDQDCYNLRTTDWVFKGSKLNLPSKGIFSIPPLP